MTDVKVTIERIGEALVNEGKTDEATRVKQCRTLRKVVDTFIDLAWDLQAFTEFILPMKLLDSHKVRLLGEAVLRTEDWST